MSGSATETLTAALRRLADEHASGLLSVATPGRDVVLELADGIPVGIGPTHDVSHRIGRDAGPELVAAAVIDELVDRTVAAIVGGEGQWTWDVASDADMMPVPDGLAAELSRRAVDAAQALANLDRELVLQPGRDLETTGEVARVRALFEAGRSIEDVAAEADLPVPTVATIAAALVRAGVLTTGMDDRGPPSWTDTVAGAADEDDEDEPELWVMDAPDDLDEEDVDGDAADDADEPVAPGPTTNGTDTGDPDPGAPVRLRRDGQPASVDGDAPGAAAGGDEPDHDISEAMEWVAEEDPQPARAAAVSEPPGSPADDDFGDTTWLDELDDSAGSADDPPVVEVSGEEPPDAEPQQDVRSALSSMISELQGSGTEQVQPRKLPPAAEPGPDENELDNGGRTTAAEAGRREPKAEPGEVAEFLRELSRLALDED